MNMMMVPRRRNDFDLWDDIFGRDPIFSDDGNKVMRTDIKEKENEYIMTIDLPGYEKKDIKIHIEDGYLNINAKTDSTVEDKEEGKFVRKERYYGECSRSFYVGEDITETDIRASFRNGTLRLEIPKREEKKAIAEKKYIEIED